MVIWLIGLSGAGKTTLGQAIAKQWKALAPNTVLLDGDQFRQVFSPPESYARGKSAVAYSIEDRRINAERMTRLCELLDDQGINVVCCILSIFPEMRAGNRQRFSRYFEIFLDAPLDTLRCRDPKGIYAAADRTGGANVVGLGIPFPRPSNPDLVIDSGGPVPDLDQLAKEILMKAGAA